MRLPRVTPVLALAAAFSVTLALSSCSAGEQGSAPGESSAAERAAAQVPGWELEEAGFQLNAEVENGPEVVMYTDFQCPYCANAEDLYEYVGRALDGEANVLIRHFPLSGHRNAMMAARAVQAAALQGGFETMGSMLYRTQEEWSGIDDGDELRQLFTDYALQIGLDGRVFAQDLDSPRVEETIAAQKASGQKLGVRGTPSFAVDGRVLEGVDSGTDRETMLLRIREAYRD